MALLVNNLKKLTIIIVFVILFASIEDYSNVKFTVNMCCFIKVQLKSKLNLRGLGLYSSVGGERDINGNARAAHASCRVSGLNSCIYLSTTAWESLMQY